MEVHSGVQKRSISREPSAHQHFPAAMREDSAALPRLLPLLFGRPRSSALRANWLPNTLGTNLRNRTPLPHQCHLRNPNEEPMLDHARHVVQRSRQRRRICDLSEAAIQNVMTFIGNESRAVGASPQLAACAQCRNLLLKHCLRERDDLYGKGKLTESGDDLTRI